MADNKIRKATQKVDKKKKLKGNRVFNEIKNIAKEEYAKDKKRLKLTVNSAQHVVQHPVKSTKEAAKAGGKFVKKRAINAAKKTLIYDLSEDIPALGRTIAGKAAHYADKGASLGRGIKNTAKYAFNSDYRKQINDKIAENISDSVDNAWKTASAKVTDKYNKIISLPQRVKDNITNKIDSVKEVAGNIKDTAVKVGNTAKSAYDAGKKAVKFIKQNGGVKGTLEKGKENLKKKAQNFNKDSVKESINNRLNKLKNQADKEDGNLVNRAKNFGVNVAKGLNRAGNRIEDKIINFIKNFRGTIVLVAKVSGIAVIISALVLFGFTVYGGFTGVVGTSPHYYCDVDAPGMIKKRNSHILYCNVSGGNDSIAEAALSLIELNWEQMKITTGGNYDGTEFYQSAYNMFYPHLSVEHLRNCVTFVDVALAYAGVDEVSIPRRNAKDNADIFASDDNWTEVTSGWTTGTDIFESLEPGTVVISQYEDAGHIFIYIGAEKMQEKFPDFDSSYILAEGSWSDSALYSYGGIASSFIETCNHGCRAFVYEGELNPRDIE